MQENQDIFGGKYHLIHSESAHVLEGLQDGGPVPQHGVECLKEADKLGGSQGRPVGEPTLQTEPKLPPSPGLEWPVNVVWST